jgi:prepilin-type N-terminal cleavage/methylation domain-containing protein
VSRRDGFTLIEVLAVVLLTGLVLGVALDFYLDLSRASQRAVDVTRSSRRSAAVLDRIAQDLESAVLVKKPAAVDPLAHPWIFRAESQISEVGADRVLFVTRNHDPGRTAAAESDLVVVSYVLRRDEEGALALWRAETPWLPGVLDREFPAAGDEREALLADGVAAFGIVLFDESMAPQTGWDSSLMVESSELPGLAEVRLAMQGPGEELPLEELTFQQRRVRLAVRPVDMEKLLEPGGEEDDDDEGGEADLAGKTVCDCIPCGTLAANPSTARLIQEIGGQPAQQWLNRMPAHLREGILPECR